MIETPPEVNVRSLLVSPLGQVVAIANSSIHSMIGTLVGVTEGTAEGTYDGETVSSSVGMNVEIASSTLQPKVITFITTLLGFYSVL